MIEAAPDGRIEAPPETDDGAPVRDAHSASPDLFSEARSKTLVMGVVNVTPDSFYDGGELGEPALARACVEQLVRDGADLVDIGGESSRPGARPVGLDEELKRVLPVLELLQLRGSGGTGAVTVSVDTYRAETARRALALGASMINDITGLRADAEMAEVVGVAGCPCVVMHMRGSPETMQGAPRYDDVVDEICAFFEERITTLTALGLAESQIWLDPGFGFGKTVEHNLTMLQRLRAFKRFGRPLLTGTSNKSTIGDVLGLPVHDRLEGTAATVAIAIRNGADCVRVHDVKAMARVARMSDAIVRVGT